MEDRAFIESDSQALPPGSAAGGSHPGLAVVQRLNVHVMGEGQPTLLFCSGFNCEQQVWHYLTGALAEHYQLVLFDQMGTGQSDRTAYDPEKYATLAGYAQDVVDICQALNLHDVVLVGHSAGGTIALLAATQAPQYIAKVVLLAASPCYLNEPGYYGGFEPKDIAELLAAMGTNYQSWANTFAIMLVGQQYPTALSYELAGYFAHSDPVIAKSVIHLTFLTDLRPVLPQLRMPILLLQCTEDAAVPAEVNAYWLAHLPHPTLVTLPATGHFPHLTAPAEVLAAMRQFLA